MVKILHFSDTHVSHRRFRDVKDAWKIQNRVTWIEEDYCNGFQKALEIAAETKCEYVVHSGDLFDTPVGRNLLGPTEYSRTFVIRELKKFFEKTANRVPVIIIDGNHGSYLTRNYSTIEFIQAAFPNNVFICTNYQLKKAMVDNKPLIIEFKNINFYLFPYFKFGRLPHLAQAYEEWVRNNQQPDSNKLSVAVVHGMQRGMDLHELILQYPYDYVALGHDHKQRKVKKNAWQAGSTEKHTFAERDHEKSVLEVQVVKGKDPIALPIPIKSKRKMIQFKISLKSDTTPSAFENVVREKLVKFKKKFVGETASRVKVKLEGTIILSNWWAMEDNLVDIQKEVFDDTYNILEFRWDDGELVKRAPISQQKGAKIYEYLIDDPVKDFEKYIRSLGIEDEKHINQMIEMGAVIVDEVFNSTSPLVAEGKEE
jgi:DNA repair exonuclease SbcCD nuclease subunit